MAASDRFAATGHAPMTPLQRYIQNACDPQNFEPNLALNLEICDLITAKKGNTPREAAMSIVNHVNNRNPNVSLLALNLLDICVKNCGYPFHLQISTKDFLNEIVRRFPERPPIRYSRVQNKILELIEEWRLTICKNSKYKEDLGFIRDMHRLLSAKGYMFPEVKREDAAVLNPSDALRSAEEMEEEERSAQSAKLQELIRRGTPHDLQEANKLMKVMAGYDNRHKTDYRAKAAEEVGRIQQKAKILEEMLQEHTRGDESINDDGFEELAAALASAQPKIQRMCEEESDDTEAVAKLFEINDSIHRTLQRYRLTKKGDLEGAARIPKGTLGTSGAGVSTGPGNELSLIDFGSEDAQSNAASAATIAAATSATSNGAAGGGNVEDDLLGLSIQDSSQGGGGAISLGPSSLAAASQAHSSTNRSATASPQARLPPQANYDLFKSLDFSLPTTSTLPPSLTTASTTKPAAFPHAHDPFAALSTPGRQASPAQILPHQGQLPSTSTPLAALHTAPITSTNRSSADDGDWAFSSALPAAPVEAEVALATSGPVGIVFRVSRASVGGDIDVRCIVSNNTAQPIGDYTFQAAVMKGYTMQLETQSGRTLAPQQRGGITQRIRVQGVTAGAGTAVRLRWKASYYVGAGASAATTTRQEQGELAGLGVL